MTALMLLVEVAGQAVAIDAARVEAVVDLADIVPVPLAPAHIRGLTAIRSQVATVVDCSASVGGPLCRASRAVVVDQGGHRYAFLVDLVDDVVPCTVVEGPPGAPLASGWANVASAYVDLGGRFALVVDPAALIFPNASALAA